VIQNHLRANPHLKARSGESRSVVLKLKENEIGSGIPARWTIINSRDLRGLLRKIIIDQGRPLFPEELLGAMLDMAIAVSSKDQVGYLRAFLASKHLSFVHFRMAGYWPADIPCAAFDYSGTPDDEARALYCSRYESSRRRSKRSAPLRPVPYCAPLPWEWKQKLCALEWALRRQITTWPSDPNNRLRLTIWIPERAPVEEEWLLLQPADSRSFVTRLLEERGRPMSSADVLEHMVSSRVAFPSLNQRGFLRDLLRIQAAFVRIPGQGYLPASVLPGPPD
jgi:hypothetical protein